MDLSSNRADLEQAQAKVQFDRGELTYRQRDLTRTQNLAKDLLVPATKVDEADLSAKSKELELTQGGVRRHLLESEAFLALLEEPQLARAA